jgi:glycosyltransferase involved in cell wall biosynthesis
LNVLAVATYPVTAASTRLRIAQFIEPLRAHGIHVTLKPFLDPATFDQLYDRRRWCFVALSLVAAVFRRLLQLPRLFRADLVFVQREAMLLGPPIFEWVARRVLRRPILLDLDDATFLERDSPVYGRLATVLKGVGKTNRLIALADAVICGSENVASYVRERGKPAMVMPTIVETALFQPLPFREPTDVPLVGWVGSHSTYPYFERIIPVLERLAESYRFRVRVVGAGRASVEIRGVEVENLRWSLDREVDDFRTIDIGLYPMPADDPWTEGKSGLKAIQYLAVGVPFVATPVGIVNVIGDAGRTHLAAMSDEGWYEALAALLGAPERRRQMGAAGRAFALSHYSVEEFASRIAAQMRAVDRSSR